MLLSLGSSFSSGCAAKNLKINQKKMKNGLQIPANV